MTQRICATADVLLLLLCPVWSSLDYGISWTLQSVSSNFGNRSRFGVAVNGKDVVVIGTTNGQNVSFNGAFN